MDCSGPCVCRDGRLIDLRLHHTRASTGRRERPRGAVRRGLRLRRRPPRGPWARVSGVRRCFPRSVPSLAPSPPPRAASTPGVVCVACLGHVCRIVRPRPCVPPVVPFRSALLVSGCAVASCSAVPVAARWGCETAGCPQSLLLSLRGSPLTSLPLFVHLPSLLTTVGPSRHVQLFYVMEPSP